ncbi:dihydroorotate dehydrogenase [Alicyclobacillus fastidiosus]|uniref:Dihydroorotate dehydrogenase n=1 Tax=Alicyclobacillus fastidiosus TaxID=392011 RepID=A0ABY6ZJP8_9BACL|nr:dihydroorotate dehydrogenase [Alicyclobacillus fastidiosus]WAH43104.1 dihydroorotate dehydrogenase [Alicyclobacillus fastidiosus]GMA65103.1 dihydroorotate dehydrogenase [Alicyclobacillus fastidiosus]
MTNVDLHVKIGSLTIKNPVMPASGTFSEDLANVFDISRLGAVVTKSVVPDARLGNPSPRAAETAAGMLNAVGIQSKGVDAFIAHTIPFYRNFDVPLVVSISAETADRFAEMAGRLTLNGVSALEVNISCPNLEDNGRSYAMDPAQTERVVTAVRRTTPLPLIVKLTPNTNDIVDVALAAESAGADAVLIANTFLAMAIDIETRRPKLGNIMGGLSGPAIKPIVLRMVYQAARRLHVPVIGCGGICSAEDALEYLIAGATAVQVGTYTFVQPSGMLDIIDGIERYAERHGVTQIGDLVNTVDVSQCVSL